MNDDNEVKRKSMLRNLARKNAALGAVQIGQLSKKQLAIDKAQWDATATMVAGWATEKPVEAPKQTPSVMATYAMVA